MDPVKLWFRLSEVVPIAEHAVAATGHTPSLSQQLDNEPAQPSLMWVSQEIPAAPRPHLAHRDALTVARSAYLCRVQR
ncbi:hypothetical protein [Nocardia suismassiliense]|uniref:hypothetical protein n=1 Tax=Nocardia suismassiliense TaxID=2077092 RepID=UPI000D1D9643|nr:hypothetical protein [Nocardia suismassiliense]